MKFLQDLSLEELTTEVLNLNEKSYRAKQIFENIYNGKTLDEMTNVPKELKQKLKQSFCDEPIKITKVLEDEDGTKKFLYTLNDQNIIEGVLMKYKYGNTLCVSTQVGCRMGCKFCASSLQGLLRNLSAGEILGQVLCVNKMLGGTAKDRQITNLVLMGSGEPLDNFLEVSKFLKLVTSKDGINFSARNISVSTCGLVPKIKELANLGLPIILTISLHAPNDQIRKTIMPIANKYKIKDIISASKYYFENTGRRVIFEYALIDGINNTKENARELSFLTKGFPSHINLIPLNEVKERGLKTVSHKNAENFCEMLKSFGCSASVRRTMGENIEGACGQLRNKFINKNGD